MDIRQQDIIYNLKVNSTIFDGKVNWKIKEIGNDQHFNGHLYKICKVVAMNRVDQETSISNTLFWFPETGFTFNSLEEFMNYPANVN